MNINVYSSFLFLTNCLLAIYLGYYIYGSIFFILFLTSIYFHSQKTLLTNIIDKIAIFLVVIYGAWLLYVKYQNINTFFQYNMLFISIATFISVLVLFTYGYYTNKYCFECDEKIGEYYHFILHCLSSIGHHCILLI